MATIRYPDSGFKFDNHQRNLALTQNGFAEPRHTSTGTTIVGVKFKDGVILGADTRATAGPIVADKNCEKIHYIAPNIWCAGAGTAADTDFTTSLISSNLALHSLSTGRTPRVITAVTQLKQYLFRYQGHIGAYLIVAGVDPTGTHLFGCQAHGSTDKLPYMTLGSGSLAAMGVLECDFRVGMEKAEAMDLVCRAVLGGVWNDLGSGGSVDLVIMENDKPTQVIRPYTSPNPPPVKQQSYKYAIGTTKVLKESVYKKFTTDGKAAVVVNEQAAPSAMELD